MVDLPAPFLPIRAILSFSFITNDQLSVVSFPSVTDIYLSDGYAQVSQSPNLTSFSLGNLTSFKVYEFNILAAKLSSANVNALLHSFTTITPTLTGKRIWLAGMTPVAPPTGQGINDKNTLMANGNNVYTD